MSSNLIFVGIDPGLKGGLAAVKVDALCLALLRASARPMPVLAKPQKGIDAARLFKWLQLLAADGQIVSVSVERVHSMRAQGVTSSFTFGEGYGKVLAVVEALQLPLLNPTPQAWQKLILGQPAKKVLNAKRDKGRSIRWVMDNYPNINLLATARSKKPHDGMAEAVCLCEYGRRLFVQDQASLKQLNEEEKDNGKPDDGNPVRRAKVPARGRRDKEQADPRRAEHSESTRRS